MGTHRELIKDLLSKADIQVNGPRLWDIQVRDERFYPRVLKNGSRGLGESYMAGWWDCSRLDEFFCRLLRGRVDKKIGENLKSLFYYLYARLFNPQSPARAHIIAQQHYDLGNDLFLSFLDPYNQYSCAYYSETADLEEAQQKKLDLICRKINLQPQDQVLDIGCGWGGLARYAAEKYGCTVTAVNISDEQIDYARKSCGHLPVNIIRQDYRKIRGTFDKIVSVGMFEHVGPKNYRTFMQAVHRCLIEEGIFLLQTIGGNHSRFNCDPWVNRYIFPNGTLPSLAQIGRAAEGLFVIEDVHNLGSHYEKTLLAWNERFQQAWPGLSGKYDETFKKMWEYYLLSCAGAFRARSIQLWQIVLTRGLENPDLCRCT